MAWNDGKALTADEIATTQKWFTNEAKGDTKLLSQKADEFGLNNSQRQQLGLVGQAYAGGRELQDWEKQQARTWATGKTGQEVADKANEMGVTADQLGQVFGWTGADSKAGGYGTTEGLKPDYRGMKFDGTKWYKPATPQATGMVATAETTPWNVTSDQLVENRTNNIIKADSPLMQQARGGAMQAMNERGLINSSLAVGAAQDAVLNKAIEIAKPDAQTYADAAQFNAGAKNTASMFNAGQTNTFNIADRELTQKGSQFDRQLNQQQTQFDQDLGFRLKQLGLNWDIATMDDQTRRMLGQLSASTAGVAAGISAAGQMAIADADRTYRTSANRTQFLNNAYGNYQSNVLKITLDPSLEPDVKTRLINAEVAGFKTFATMNDVVGDFSFVDSYANTITGKNAGTPPPPPPPPPPSGDEVIPNGKFG